jgi:hypothetical protein
MLRQEIVPLEHSCFGNLMEFFICNQSGPLQFQAQLSWEGSSNKTADTCSSWLCIAPWFEGGKLGTHFCLLFVTGGVDGGQSDIQS